MAPHWKCGSGQPVAGSNPALSATASRGSTRWVRSRLRSSLTQLGLRSLRCSPPPSPRAPARGATTFMACRRRRDGMRLPQIYPLVLGECRFAADEPWAGEVGVVVGYAIRHRRGVLLFDTGFGFGNDELDA